jgi:hypothetical protein
VNLDIIIEDEETRAFWEEQRAIRRRFEELGGVLGGTVRNGIYCPQGEHEQGVENDKGDAYHAA